MNKYKIINKSRFYTIISLILIILFASMFFIIVNAKSTSTEVLVPVYVREGDSLWKLSAEFCDKDIDIRNYISRVININNMTDPNIQPGELLLFPLLKEQ